MKRNMHVRRKIKSCSQLPWSGAVSKYLIFSLFFVFCLGETINTFIKLKKDPMNKEEADGKYMCETPFGLQGRPVFGGQIFSHIISCALKETENYEVISGDCVFKDKTEQSLPIIYKSTVEALGRTVKLVNVNVCQTVDGVEVVRAVGVVLMQKSKTAIQNEKKVFIETIAKRQKNTLQKYFSRGTPDREKIKQMKTPKVFWKEILNEKDFKTYSDIIHDRYNSVDLYMLQDAKSPFARCIGYQMHPPAAPSTHETTEVERINEIYKHISYISDENLLETALISQGLCIINSKYNILTISHSVKFNSCETFDLFQPFFYSIKIKSIENNIAMCSGKIVQNDTVYANIHQVGKIMMLPGGNTNSK
ncbi:hypothetical protein NEMIN01_0463 [Nematocida minor]|uniref:uncharacterized protein n=1 Tax=Nematocida minor TaxID=1912983 RepID=UPI00221F26FB|nr:uncharacterized protein NEMIN01_0463 [Nematocida minor]KAI5189400.1 hypothetical protein NEMIN01_0463 [Nematocida minor]